VATPSSELPRENVRYDFGREDEQMTYDPLTKLAAHWELSRSIPRST
jgi:hypothetical protein